MPCEQYTFNHADEHPLKATLGNERWMRENEERIKALFPVNGMLITNFAFKSIARDFMDLGMQIRNASDMSKTLVYLQYIGILKTDSRMRIKPNPNSIFDLQKTPSDFYRIKTRRSK